MAFIGSLKRQVLCWSAPAQPIESIESTDGRVHQVGLSRVSSQTSMSSSNSGIIFKPSLHQLISESPRNIMEETANIAAITKAANAHNVNLVDEEGNTPLHLILQQANWRLSYHAEIVSILLKAGAEVNLANNAGRTALHTFLLSGYHHLQTFGDLINAGGDVNIPNDYGKTPLCMLQENYLRIDASIRTEMLQLLANKGINVTDGK